MIICITGLAGSGKSTIAKLLKKELEKLNYKVFHYTSDFVATELFNEKFSSLSQINADYSDSELKVIYNGLYLLFDQILKSNSKNIIITDGMYRNYTQRMNLQMIADKNNCELVVIKVDTDNKVAFDRLVQREKNGGHSGWVNPEFYEEPIRESILSVNNNENLSKVDKQIENILKKIRLNSFNLYS